MASPRSITTLLDVTPGQTYTIEFRIADFFDPFLDSAVFVNYFGGALIFDADDDNSSGAQGADFNINFNSAGTDIVDADAAITNYDNLSDIQSATVTLTNGKIGDVLTLDAVTLAGLGITPSGVPAGPLTSDGSVTITLSGIASEADYLAALQTFQFDTSALSPDTENRIVEIELTADNGAVSNMAITTIKVVPEVVTPIADQTADDGDAISINASFIDPDGDTLTYSATGLPPGLMINTMTGEITGTLDASASNGGPYTVTVTATDGNGGSADDVFNFTVNNPAPTGAPNTVTTNEDTDYPFSASDFGYSDGGSDGDALASVRIDTLPTDGTLFLDDGLGGLTAVSANDVITAADISAGNLIFRPDTDESGNNYASFNFSVSDGSDFAASPSTMTVDVTPVNDAPTVDSTAITVDEESEDNNLGLAAPTDPDGPSSTITVTGLPTLGAVTLANGTPVTNGQVLTPAELTGLQYDAPADYDGVADPGDFTYSVNDGVTTVNGSVDITVNAVNDAPTVDSNAITVDEESEDNALGLAAPTDPDGPSSTITVTGLPTLGTVTLANGTPVTNGQVLTPAELTGLQYDAPADYDGIADPGDFAYSVNDGVTTVNGSVDITVNAVNDAPTVDSTAITVDEETTDNNLGLAAPTDPDGPSSTITVTGLPTLGTVTLANGTPVTNGQVLTPAELTGLQYDAPADYDGVADPGDFTYSVDDGVTTVNGSVDITVNAVNDAPTVDSTAITVDEESEDNALGLAAPTDPDGPSSTITVTGLPTLGTVTLANGTPVTNGQVLTPAELTGLQYDAPADYDGVADPGDFTYSVNDGVTTVNGSVDVTVNAINDAPTVDSTAITVDEETTDNNLGLAAPTDPDGPSSTITVTGLPTLGTVTLANGTPVTNGQTLTPAELTGLQYDAPADYDGVADPGDFTYEVTDGTDTVSGSVDITVNAVNDAPIVDSTAITVDEESEDNNLGLAAPTDPDGPSSTITVTGLPTLGTVTLANGTPVTNGQVLTPAQLTGLQYDAPADYDGVADPGDFTYSVNDGVTTVNGSVDITVNAVNDAPVAQDDNVAATEDSAGSGDLLTNNGAGIDDDIDGDTLMVSAVNGVPANVGTQITLASGALLTVNSDGTYTYDPNGQFENLDDGETATDSFTYTVDDGNGGTDTATVTVTIGGANDAPVVDSTAITVDEESTDNTLGLTTPIDPDGEPVTITVTGLPTLGAVTLANGTPVTNGQALTPAELTGLQYDAPADYDGVADPGDFTYEVSDGDATVNGSVDITVTPVNDTPTLTGASIPTQNDDDSDVIAPIDATTLFNDPDGDALSYSATGLPPGVTIDPMTGAISGQLDSSASQSGPFTVTVTATDPDLEAVSTTFTWNVTNPGPVAADDGIVNVTEDTSQTIDPLANDNDVDGDALAITQINGTPISQGSPVALPSGATVSLNPEGTLTYEPATNQNGLDSFDYTVADADGAISTASVNLDIGGVNDAPTANGALPPQTFDDAETVGPIATAPFFDDLDNDTLSYSAANLPPGLTIDSATGEISGVVDPSASVGGPGGDGVYQVTVTATDPSGETASFMTTVSIENPAPTANQIPVQTIIDAQPVSIPAGDAFDDVDGDVLTFTASGLPPWASINPATGEITGVAPNDASASGDFTVTVTADDGEGGTVSETFLVSPQNPSPDVTPAADQTNNDGDTVSFDGSAAFDDPDGDTLTYSATGLPPGLSIDPATGLVTGTIPPNASQGGPYTVAITATDSEGAAATDTFVWNVENPDPSVVGQIPNQAANDGDPFDLSVTPYFVDADPDDLTYSANGLPPGLSIDPLTGVISGTLASDASMDEPYVVAVTVDDGEGGSATDTFIFSVNNVNPGLVEQVDNQASNDGDAITAVSVFDNFDDPDGDPLTFSATGLPPGLTIDPSTGVISGTLDTSASQGGPYEVVVTASDGTNDIVDAFVWEVDNPKPVVTGVAPDQTDTDGDDVSVPTAAFFNDPDGDDLTFSAEGLPPGLTIDPVTGVISGALPIDASINGPYSVTLTATDSDGDTVSTAFTWNVGNIPPVVTDTPEDVVLEDNEPVDVSLADLFEDPDGDPVVYSATGLPPGLSIDPETGVLSGVVDPSASQGGPYTPIITATDDSGDSASVVISVDVVNPAPEATPDVISVVEDTPTALPLLANDVDPDGDPLFVSAIDGIPVEPGDVVTLASGGVVTVGPDGAVTYTPPADFNGEDAFTYTISDGEGGESTALATVDVTPVNDAPRLTEEPFEIPPAVVGEETEIDVSIAVDDIDDTLLTYQADNLPPGLTIDPSTGVISGAPSPEGAGDGPYLVTITVTDPDGASVDFAVLIEIDATGVDVNAIIGAGSGQPDGDDVVPNADGTGDAVDSAGFGAVSANGHVIEAANGLSDLGSIGSLGAEGVILAAVNGADSLNGVADLGARDVMTDRIRSVIAAAESKFGGVTERLGVQGAEGFSTKTYVAGAASADPSTDVGQFVIDTFVRDNVLFVELFDTIDRVQSSGFEEFTATLGDGRPLPSWISFSPDGLLMIDRPANVEVVTLRITGLRENGGFVTRTVEIDTPTGEIREASGQTGAFGLSFTSALQEAALDVRGATEETRTILQSRQ